MKIRNEKERAMFENTIDRCHRTIWLVTANGNNYDLKKPAERSLGIAEMVNATEYDEPELYVSCVEDEMTVFEFLTAQKAS